MNSLEHLSAMFAAKALRLVVAPQRFLAFGAMGYH